MNLYISNLSPETTEEDLEKAFSEFGAIKSLKIIIDRETNTSKGYGFVEMEDKGAGFDAIDYIDMSYLKGNIVNVREAKNNKEGTPSNANKKRSFQPRQDRPYNSNYKKESNYNRDGGGSNYNRNNSDGYNRSYNQDKDYNNDLSYNA